MSTILSSLPVETPAEPTRPQANWLQRWQTRVTESDGLSSMMAIADQGMLSGTNFVAAVVIGRCCGAEILGLYALIAAAMAMIIGLQDQLITAPYVLYHNRKHGQTLRRYAGSVLLHHCGFIVLIMLGMLACVAGVQQASETVRLVTFILFIGTPAILLRTFIREISLAHCDVLTVFILDAAVCVTRLITVVALFAFDSVNLPAIYGVLGITCVLTAGIWMARNRGRFVFHRRSVIVDWRRNWRFGRWALATHVAGTSTPYMMPWVLFLMHGERATGYLASCSVIVGVCNILLAGMCDFLSPRAAAAYATGGINRLRKIQWTMLKFSVLAIGAVCIMAALFGEQIIDALYDGRFPGAGGMVVLLTLSVLANAIGLAAGNGLWALDKPRANFVADMVTLTVAVAAAPALVGPFGARGAAMATLAASVFGAVCRQLIYQQAAGELQRSEVQR